MTKEEKLNLFEAWLDGATIEFRDKGDDVWEVTEYPLWNFDKHDYRAERPIDWSKMPRDTVVLRRIAEFKHLRCLKNATGDKVRLYDKGYCSNLWDSWYTTTPDKIELAPQSRQFVFPWHGGKRPVDPSVIVEVKLLKGDTLTGKARDFDWQHRESCLTPKHYIISYQIVGV